MGFWPFGSTEKKQKEVCIPEARRIIDEKEVAKQMLEEEKKQREQLQKQKLEEQQLPTFHDDKPRIFVEEVFSVSDTLMIKGTVVSGRITKRSKVKINKKTFSVKDLQLKRKSVGSLTFGQTGAVFFNKAKGLYVKTKQVIQFT